METLSRERGKEPTFSGTEEKKIVKVFKGIMNIVGLLANECFSVLE